MQTRTNTLDLSAAEWQVIISICLMYRWLTPKNFWLVSQTWPNKIAWLGYCTASWLPKNGGFGFCPATWLQEI